MKRVRKAISTNSLDFLDNAKNTVRGKYAIKTNAVAKYIGDFKNSSNYKQSEIADNLEMKESQLSLWLSGFHNLTLQSIIKLESACPIEILNPALWENTSLAKKPALIVSATAYKNENIDKGVHTSRQITDKNNLYAVKGGDNSKLEKSLVG